MSGTLRPAASSFSSADDPFLSVALADDTGSSSADALTNDPSLRGTAEAGSTVVLSEDGTTVATVVAAADGSWRVAGNALDLQDGTHTITATDIDTAGDSATTNVAFDLDTTPPPSPEFNEEANYTSTPVLSGTADDGASVAILFNGEVLGTTTADASTGAWTYQVATPLAIGTYTVAAQATDAAGNVSELHSEYDVGVGITAPGTPSLQLSDPENPESGPSNLVGTGTAGDIVNLSSNGPKSFYAFGLVDSDGIWSIPALGLQPGSYDITAVQSSDYGNSPSSDELGVGVGESGLLMSMALANDTGSSSADALTNDASLQGVGQDGSFIVISENGLDLGAVFVGANGNWSIAGNKLGLEDGTHTITATDFSDTSEDHATAQIVFTLDTTPPVVSFSSASILANTSTPILSGSTEDGASVAVLLDGQVLGTTTADASTGAWTYQVTTPLATGTYTVAAQATDAAGNVSIASASTLEVLPTAPGTPSLQATDDAASGATLGDYASPTFTGTGTVGDEITLLDGSTAIGTAGVGADGTWSITTSTPLNDGSHAITAVQTNTTGLTSSASDELAVAVTPIVSVALADDTGSSSTDGLTRDASLKGTAEVGTTVRLSENGATLATVVAAANGSWSVPGSTLDLKDGTHTITATDTDAAGNSSTAQVALTLDTVPPVVSASLADDTGSSSTDGLTRDASLKGTAEVGTTVRLSENGATLATVVAAANGSWSVPGSTLDLKDGTHTITATDTDAAGNSSTAQVALTLDTVPPVVSASLADDTGSSSTDGLTRDASLKGTAEVGTTVRLSENGATLATVVAAANGSWSVPGSTLDLKDGTHTITATDTDAAGNSSTAQVALTLDTVPPVVSASLADDTGSSSTDGLTRDASLKGTAEVGTTVRLSENGATLATVVAAANGSWSVPGSTLDLKDGTHTITATDTDAAGNSSTAQVTLTLDTVPPVVSASLADDTGSSSTDGLTRDASLKGTAEVGTTVRLSENGATLATVVAAANGSWSVPGSTLDLKDGTHTITATDTDAAGNSSTAQVTLTLDTVTPIVSVALADDTGSSSTDGLTRDASLKGTAEVGTTVRLSENGATLATVVAAANGSWSVPGSTLDLKDGTHTITATDTDAAGNSSTAQVTLTLDTVPPVVSAALADDTGSSSTDGLTRDASLKGTAEVGTTVRLSENGATLATVVAAANGSWSVPGSTLDLKDGTHTITATDTDAAGNSSTAQVALTLDTVPPVVSASLADDTGSSSTDGLTRDASLKGTAEVGTTVRLSENGATLATVVAAANGSWSVPGSTLDLKDGTHTITATDTGAAGNSSTAQVTLTLDTVPPAVSVGSASILANTSTPILSGSAEDGASVTVLLDGQVLGTVTASTSTGIWNYQVTTAIATGTHAIAAQARDEAGNVSAVSAASTLLVVPAPATSDGVSTADLASPTYHQVVSENDSVQFVPGTEAVNLADGTLSVGPDTEQAYIARLYEGLLGRSEDTPGITGWNADATSGASNTDIASGFLGSQEGQAAVADLTNAQFVDRLYENALSRSAAVTETDYWTGALSSGATRAQVLTDIVDSPEAKRALAGDTHQVWVPDADAQLVVFTYETAFDRAPDAAGLQLWTKALTSGFSLSELMNSFVNSAEFKAIYSGDSASGLVTSLYEQGLGRLPSTAELGTFAGDLQNGTMTSADLLGMVVASKEAYTHLATTL